MLAGKPYTFRIAIVALGFFITLISFIVMAIPAELHARNAIVEARSPVPVSEEGRASFVFRTDNTWVDSSLLSILYLVPIDTSAPPPPGLTAWLEEGSVAASKEALKYRDSIERQFGPISAVIDDDVSLDREILIYVHPRNSKEFIDLARYEDGVYFASGFAKNGQLGVRFGDIEYENWATLLLPLVCCVVLLPLFASVRVARKNIHDTLAREHFILQCIGGRRRHLISHTFAYTIFPLLLGLSIGILVIVPFLLGIVSVPFTGFYLHSDAYHDWLGKISLVTLAMLVGALVYLVYPQIRLSTRKSKRKIKLSAHAGLAIFALGIVISTVLGFLNIYISDEIALILILLTMLCITVGLPATLAVLSEIVAHIRLKYVRNELSAISMRWVRDHTEQASRVGAVAGTYIVVGVVLVGIFGIVAETQQGPVIKNEKIQVVKTSVRCVVSDSSCFESALDKVSQIDPNLTVIGATWESGLVKYAQGKTNSQWVSSFISEHLEPEYGALASDVPQSVRWAWIYTLSDSNEELLPRLERIRSDRGLPYLSISYGEMEQAIALIYKQQASWLSFVSFLAFIISLVSIASQFHRESEKQARDVASIAALTGRNRLIATTITSRTLLVHLISGIVAIAVGIFVFQQFFIPIGGFFPWSFIVVISVVYLLFIALQALVVFQRVNHFASRWLPGKDHYEYSAV